MKSRAYEAIKAMLFQADIYAQSAQLRLDERELSGRLGLSRTPLRSALAQLEFEGIVRTVPRRGVLILRKSKGEILDMVSVWAALESTAAGLAAARASQSDLEELERLAGAEVPSTRAFASSDVNMAFHQAVVALGRCPLISQMCVGLFLHIRAMRGLMIFEGEQATVSRSDRYSIVSAVAARDVLRAEKAVRDCVMRLHDHIHRNVHLA